MALTTPAPVWTLLCGLWEVPEALSQRVWRALSLCGWSEVVAWRQRLIVSEQGGDPAQLAASLFEPRAVVAVLELLHQAGYLRRADASAMQGHVLRWTDATGQWK